MDADNIIAWEAPEVGEHPKGGVPIPKGVSPALEGCPHPEGAVPNVRCPRR